MTLPFLVVAMWGKASSSGLSSSDWAVPWAVAVEWTDPVELIGKQGAGMQPESPLAGIGVVAVNGNEWSDPIGLVGEQGVDMLPVAPSVGIGVVVGR